MLNISGIIALSEQCFHLRHMLRSARMLTDAHKQNDIESDPLFRMKGLVENHQLLLTLFYHCTGIQMDSTVL